MASFDRRVTFLQELVADLSDEERVWQPAGVSNHMARTLGHSICSCEAMAGELGVKSCTSHPDTLFPRGIQ